MASLGCKELINLQLTVANVIVIYLPNGIVRGQSGLQSFLSADPNTDMSSLPKDKTDMQMNYSGRPVLLANTPE